MPRKKIGKIDENTKKVNEVYTQVEKIEQIQNENITIINNIDQELEKTKSKIKYNGRFVKSTRNRTK